MWARPASAETPSLVGPRARSLPNPPPLAPRAAKCRPASRGMIERWTSLGRSDDPSRVPGDPANPPRPGGVTASPPDDDGVRPPEDMEHATMVAIAGCGEWEATKRGAGCV